MTIDLKKKVSCDKGQGDEANCVETCYKKSLSFFLLRFFPISMYYKRACFVPFRDAEPSNAAAL